MPLSYQELVAQARAAIVELTPGELAARSNDVDLLVDIRELEEYQQGSIEGAVFIPRGTLESAIAGRVNDEDAEIVVFCEVGARSALAAKALQDMGYTNVKSLAGGFVRWKDQAHAWSRPDALTVEQRSRYARHLVLPEVGETGQMKLLGAKVLLIGAGGLGSPAALYLAAAGVGTLGIVDYDVVEESNLQRQVLHRVDQVGRPKVDSARDAVIGLNRDVKIEPYRERLDAANALSIIGGYDVVIDGTDNFPTRYLVNDASLHVRTPVVHGSIFRFEGQVSVFTPYEGPCYRCLFPQPPPPELAPSCAEAGVLGVLPGIVGSIQAMEALKLILGLGEGLTGKLLTYDAMDESFRTLALRRNPGCPACGDETKPPRLVDYDETCSPVVGDR
jgi:molybdopterin/thiamine biosynthesis adenylyltransferase/rhodanese-related sulfurtransferase